MNLATACPLITNYYLILKKAPYGAFFPCKMEFIEVPVPYIGIGMDRVKA
jgi:hypothetical protein